MLSDIISTIKNGLVVNINGLHCLKTRAIG